MRKIFLSIRFLLLVIAVFSIGLFIYQAREVSIIRKELSNSKGTLRKIRNAKRKSKKIKRKILDSKQKEKEILERIPRDRNSIFALMKKLTAIGSSIGIKNIGFTMIETSQKENKTSAKRIMRRKRNPHMFNNTATAGSGLLKAYQFTMSFSASYMEMYNFIERVISMERVVSLESMEIKRNENYFPRQEVNLKLITYTLSDSKK